MSKKRIYMQHKPTFMILQDEDCEFRFELVFEGQQTEWDWTYTKHFLNGFEEGYRIAKGGKSWEDIKSAIKPTKLPLD